jgi:hypothetical protein
MIVAVPRPKLTYANVVSTICLFVVLGGAAYAATQLPKNSVGPKQLKKKAVVTAKLKDRAVTESKLADGAVTGAKVKDGSLQAGDLAPGTIPASAPPGTPPGGTLPAGTTLRGAVAASSACSTGGCAYAAGEGVSFGGYRLSSAPLANLIGKAAPPTAVCPGSVTDPQATPGNLCVYLAFITAYGAGSKATLANTTESSFSPTGITLETDGTGEGPGTITVNGDGRVSPFGFELLYEPNPHSNYAQVRGTWAVTGN